MTEKTKFLKLLRIKRELSQEELAKRLGLSKDFIQAVEVGIELFSAQQLVSFAREIGISYDLLFIAMSEEPDELAGEDLERFLKVQRNLRELLVAEAGTPNTVQ